MAKKNMRNMKVCGQRGYQYKTIPAIMLKGQWLKDWGFEIDDAVVVKCENGMLTITKADVEGKNHPETYELEQRVAESLRSYGEK